MSGTPLSRTLHASRRMDWHLPLNDAAGASTPAAVAQQPRVCHANSVWNTRLAPGEALDASHATWEAALQAQVAGTSPTANCTSFSGQLYRVPPGSPVVVPVDYDDGFMSNTNSPYKWGDGIPWPSNLRSADAEVPMSGAYHDRNISIWDPAADTVWEVFSVDADHIYPYDATTRPRGWPNVAGKHGGVFRNVSDGPGVLPDPYGTTATGLMFAAGLVFLDEAEDGVIPHAIRFSTTRQLSTFRAPATRRDGVYTGNPNALEEGIRFRLPSTFNPAVDMAGKTPLAQMVATAIRDYGMICSDGAGAVALYLEDPRATHRDYTPCTGSDSAAPWRRYTNGQFFSTIFSAANFPWSQMQALGPWTGMMPS